ncbi:host specificity protein J [Escherichia coli]|nr:host specificity protein J [Escherichia coli]PJI61120.1 host specificity protein J [Escherichia coli]
MTAVEWADQNYYLPKESSYGDGEWKTLPFQIAIMNSMGNDQIRTVNLIKSARVGYTKMLLGVVGYFIEHKSRNSLLFQPTDSAAEDFMKSHVEATIRDVPCLKDLSPWLGRKHRDNTLTLKRFSSGVGFWCLGGAAAKNYREKSVDVVCYDELSSFEPDVEKEGSPTLLGDKRIEGSVWPKSIRGSTPKIKGSCQIEKAAIRENDDGTYAITAVQHVPEKEAIVDNGAHFDGDQSGTVNGVTPPAVQHLTAEVTADSGEYQVLARWDTPKVVKGVSFMLRLTVAADDGSERLVSTARTAETTYRFTQLAPGDYRLTVRAVNAWGQQGDPASVSFRIAAPAAPSRIELTPGYFQITATPHLAVYDPTVQFEFWFSETRITDIRQVETTARYLGTALYWIAASINIKPGHDYYFYIRSVNTVGKSAFVEAVGQPSDDASGYLDFFKGEIGKSHLAQELWTQIDNGQLAPDLAEIRTSITDVSNEITQTVNKKLEDQSAAIQQIQKVQVDTNNNLNSMWAVKLQQMQDGRLYIAGIGAGIENTPDGMQSQVLLAADRIAMVNPANGNTKPMFVGQGDQIFMNEVFLKYLTAPTITSGGNPPAFSLTPDGRLTAKNADISGNVNANSGTLNNVMINENCRVLGKLSANQIEGDLVKTVGKAFPRDSRAPERWPSGTITVRVYDDQPFDRQIVIPAVAFSGARHERENSDTYSSCRLIVKKNGAEIYNRTALDNTLIYTGVIDMPAGSGVMTLEFSVSAWWVNGWYPTASISDLLVVVMKKATAGISIS